MRHNKHAQLKHQHQFIDLTHTIDENIPLWPGSTTFTKELRTDYAQSGFRVYNYHLSEGTGTHMDAPLHCIERGKSVADFTLDELIGPGCVIDVSAAGQNNPDYAITPEDIVGWEQQHGVIPAGAIVLAFTGWSNYWPNRERYSNADSQGVLHFPGFSAAAAELLVSRGISGVGIDTLSLDPGNSQTYPAHQIFLGQGLFQLENVANLHQLPATSATIFALPLKIAAGPEAPTRVIAMLSRVSLPTS